MKKNNSSGKLLTEKVPIKHFLLIMRTTFILLFTCVFCSMAEMSYTQNARVTINKRNVTLREVLNEIESQTDYLFIYNNEVNANEKVSVRAKQQAVSGVLNTLLKDKSMSYSMEGNHIILSTIEKSLGMVEALSANITQQQRKTITGTVVDAAGIPIIGANIVETGTTNGTVTDVDGKFSLSVDNNATIRISYIGYLEQDINTVGRTSFDVTLQEDTQALDEVVVVGYGTVKKSDLTSSISSIDADKLPESASLSINNMIQGRVPGVDVVSSGGLPGAGVSIKVRGVSSINNSEPLYVIDGVQFFNSGNESFNAMSMLNAQDIERIEILKDASAAAIYGANGANGVILITTKKGSKGKAKATLKLQYGVAQTPKKLDILKADEYVDLLIESQQNYYPNSPIKEIVGPTVLDYNYSRVDRTNWQDEVFRNANLYQVDMSVSGGGENANYLFSMGYADQEAIIIANDFKRYTIRMASDFRLGNYITIGENMNLMYSHRRNSGVANDAIINSLRMAPYVPVYDENNWWGFGNNNNVNDNNGADNPLAEAKFQSGDNKDVLIFGNIYTSVDFTQWLKYYASVGISFNTGYLNQFNKPYVNGSLMNPDSFVEGYSWGIYPLFEQTLTFNKILGDHVITLLGGMSVSRYGIGKSISVRANNFPNHELDNILLASNQSITDAVTTKTAGLSYFTRVNYSYANKYLLTAIFRADASSNFSLRNRWGYFPAFSAAWKLGEENFIKDNFDNMSNLKLRLGWGKNGISNIGAYQYMSNVHSRGMSYPVGQPGAERYLSGTTIKALSSPDIKWEEATTNNVGLDIGLMNNKMTFTIDYFNKKTENILVTVPTSPSMGLGLAGGIEGGSRIANAASATNNGIEVSGTYSNYDNEFKYNISANLTYVTNKVTALGAGEPIPGPQYNGQAAITLTSEGHPIGSFYGFKVDKVYESQAEVNADNVAAQSAGAEFYQSDATTAGDIRFKDLDRNGWIDDNDRDYIGNPIPKYTFGFSFDASYKEWDFATSLTGIADVDIYSAFYTFSMEGMRVTNNHSTYVRDRWTPTNTKTIVPRAVSADPSNNLRTSDRYINDGSYIKLRNLTLGYTVPTKTLNKLNLNMLSKFRVYTSAQNILTFSTYKKGFDPEVGAMNPNDLNGYNLGRGIDVGFVPHGRTFLFGFEILF